MPPPHAAPGHRATARRCRTGSCRRPTSRPPSGRSRPRSGPASRPPAARSRRSSRSSSAGSGPRSRRSPPPAQRGETVWPVIDYADIAAGTVPAPRSRMLRRRGCLVVRGHFHREQALRLGQRASSTTSRATGSSRTTAAPATTSSPASAPGRRSTRSTGPRPRCRPARATGWRGSRRSSTASGSTSPTASAWFDPDRDSLYPDRIRRRPPGADSGGLGTHLDPGTLDLWMTQAYQQAFRHLFDGTVEQYDPWDAALPHRRAAVPRHARCAPPSAPSRAGPPCPTWTTTRASCTPSRSPGPWPTSCCARCWPTCPTTTCAASRSTRSSRPARRWHPLLMRALSGIPDVQAGRLRLVALRHDPQRRPGHRTSRAGATSCTSPPPRGARATSGTPPASARPSAPAQARATFPAEHYERTWPDRFQARRPQRHRTARPRPQVDLRPVASPECAEKQVLPGAGCSADVVSVSRASVVRGAGGGPAGQ